MQPEKNSLSPHRRPECVERWPECESGAYDPRCCRFPKSCSCNVPDESPAARRRLTLGDVPEEVTFVDEAGNVLAEYGKLTIPPWFALVVLNKARRWRQSIDTTLERMMAQAIRQYVAKRA